MAFDFTTRFAVSPICASWRIVSERRHLQDWEEVGPGELCTIVIDILRTADNPPPDDEEYDPKAKNKTQKKKKVVPEAMPPPSSEVGRPNLYTLPEDHSHIFSNSMDLSFSGDGGIVVPSSQVDAYGLDDNLFGPDIANELAMELGEGWGGDQAIEYVSRAEQGSDPS
jgi:hypothetical protein